jgi:site-specific DNA-methyltransferase (adenine-specific)
VGKIVMTVEYLTGDCREVLKTLPEKHFNTVVTSPPYWGLRDYGTAEQFGLEDTPEAFVKNLVEVFKEIKRVLRDDGTVWLNLGDTYLQNKHLIGIPWRVAFALQSDGWYLRQDIIWHKPNPMPESVKDRCTKAHEYIFLLSKNSQYYYDNEAIKEKVEQVSSYKNNPSSSRATKYKNDKDERTHRQGMSKTRGEKLIVTRPNLPSQEDFVKFLRSKTNVKILSESTNIGKTTIEHWFRLDKSGFSYPSRDDWIKISDFINDWSTEYEEINQKMTYEEYHFDDVVTLDKKNKRSVWTISPKPFKEAHFAVYPTKLIEPCVLAGCPEGGHVLDPFGGSGTTGLVADRLNRNATLIDLNENYIEIAKKRIKDDAPLLVGMAND